MSAQTIVLLVKAVPGARADQVTGWLGDRLKVRVSAPPEGGKANAAICRLLASELGLKPTAVEVARGHASAEKSVTVTGASWEDVLARWPRPGGAPC
ncbi:MAG: DUF167 domain-containing protein [Phycisphaerales bacterium]